MLLVSGEGLLHACISSIILECSVLRVGYTYNKYLKIITTERSKITSVNLTYNIIVFLVLNFKNCKYKTS